MKIRLLSNNRKWSRIIAGIVVILVVISFSQSSTEVSNVAIHQSRWNEYAPEVERASNQINDSFLENPIHVYGGIVSHHIPTTIPNLVNYYSKLKKNQEVKNFIIIGPDHNDAGRAEITMSEANFQTVLGNLESASDIVKKIIDSGLVNIEEEPFEYEHSIGSQILVISKVFPEAKVVPIIVHSDTSHEHAVMLGRKIAELLDNETVLIASIDFSHYLTTEQAVPIDKISGEIIRNLDMNSLSLLKVDSSGSATAFIEAMRAKGTNSTADIQVLNTNDLMQNSDYTTGYVFGYWGVK